MKKIIKVVLAAAVLCVTAIVMSLCVSAETEDIELSVRLAKTTDGAWGQSVSYARSAFDCSRITEDTIVEVEFTLEDVWAGSVCPVELIFHNYSTADPQIWAQIKPFDTDMETYAKFNYVDMVDYYGSDDFSTVDNIYIGDCGVPVTVTKLVITNCEKVEITTTAATTKETVAETTTSAAAAETQPATEATTAASSSDGGASSIPIIPIVIVTVVVAVAVVVVVIVLKHRKRFY